MKTGGSRRGLEPGLSKGLEASSLQFGVTLEYRANIVSLMESQ